MLNGWSIERIMSMISHDALAEWYREDGDRQITHLVGVLSYSRICWLVRHLYTERQKLETAHTNESCLGRGTC